MENAPHEGEDRSSRRQRQKARRRSLIIGLIVLAVAVALVGVVMLAGCSHTTGAHAATSPAAQATPGSQAVAAVSASAASPNPLSAMSPTPSPSPSRPPLDKPTKKHPLRVYFGGDSLAGLPGVLFAEHGANSGLMKVRTDYQVSSRLTDPDPVDWPAHLKAQMHAVHPDVGVFMIGSNDPGMPMIARGAYTSYPKKAWLEEYQRRAERLMLLMLHDGAQRVYWVGLPVMPDKGQTNQVKRLNELFRKAAAQHPAVVYVDTFDLLATKNGGFIAALRSGDGVHFTNEGAGRIADAVWAAIKRDWRPGQ